ncbi:GNAT family N-acetyltransferase [Bacillus firmus]|uniref:GNAT family N-acetyltransferase n=1 Tax=Cytobacillus firmus TaxID=1399 RepID=UPI001580162E|nr:GNAT family N-acetyltransferase [Cytobacillus firmus]NUH86462.1 GNAT family N-acetyltransferase [Cytobacillus firmus]
MDIFDQIFSRTKISPLKRKNDIEFEIKYQSEWLINKGFEIISRRQKGDHNLILYRHFYEGTPKEDETIIFLGIRIITKKGILYPDPVLKAFFNDDFTDISLADIEIEKYLSNHGYGSILLSTLIEIAKKGNIDSITGWISSVDFDHLERLVHFYKKHNFEVILDENSKGSLKIGDLIWKSSK